MSSKRKHEDTGGTQPAKVHRLTSEKPRLHGKTVPVRVGEDLAALEEFHVHEELLRQHSGFFEAALSARWTKRTGRTVPLPEDHPVDFERFQGFLYSGRVYLQEHSDEEHEHDDTMGSHEWLDISHAWSLGDKLQSGTYKDAVTDSLINKITDGPYFLGGLYRMLKDGGPKSAGFRRLLVDIAVFAWDEDNFRDLVIEKTSQMFLKDLLVALAECRWDEQPGQPWLKGDCRYHDHGDESPCYKTLFPY